jgi:NAD-dependent deacetylase
MEVAGSACNVVSNQTAPKSIALQLAEATEQRERADKVTAEARQAVADAKKATVRLSENIGDLDHVIHKASSFDEQWQAFQAMFDNLNKQMCQKLAGMMGVSGGGASKRPAEMTSVKTAAQVISRAKNLVVLTGAGISAESGIPTFRGADGFWTVGSENYRPQELATWEKFNEMPEELWKWYQYRWGICTKAKPNPGHYALVELEKLVRCELTLVTQNIDGLHLEAGSNRKQLFEVHGRIDEMRCDECIEGACLHGVNLNDMDNFAKVKATIVKTPAPAKKEEDEKLPHCKVCGVRQRPKILWFDECYNETIYGYQSVKDAMDVCDVLLVIGTQLTTGLPKNMVSTALSKGTTIIKMDTVVDLEDEYSAGMLHLQAKSGEALPQIISEIRKLQQEPALAPLRELPKGLDPVLSPPSSPLSDTSAQPLQGSPALSLRRNSSVAKVGMGAPANGLRNSSAVGRKNSIPAAGRSGPAAKRSSGSLPGAAPGAAARSRSSGVLKAAASASLRKESLVNTSSDDVNTTAEGFFVYGTLRPDDDSGATWTKNFCEGMACEPAFLSGASLYIDGSYPAVSLEKTRCSVRGAFLQPASKAMFNEKLLEADRIEGYPDLYDRIVVLVQTASGTTKRAYLYHRTGRTDRSECVRILDGDWLSRKRG